MTIKKQQLVATCLFVLAIVAGGIGVWTCLGDSKGRHTSEEVGKYKESSSSSGSDSASASSTNSSEEEEVSNAPRFKLIRSGEDWEKVIEWFADTSNLTYAEGSCKPTGTLTLVPPKGSKTEFTLGEIIDLLDEALLARKEGDRYVLVRREFTFTFVAADDVDDSSWHGLVSVDDLAKHGKIEIVKVVIPVKVGDATEVAELLKPLKSPFGTITRVPPNSLFVVDTVGVIRGSIIPAVARHDRGVEQYLHTCKHVSALAAKKMLMERFTAKASKDGDDTIRTATDEERNMVIVSGPADLVARAKKILLDFDKP
jgi:hypothetical protein